VPSLSNLCLFYGRTHLRAHGEQTADMINVV